MYKILISRTVEIKAPFQLVAGTNGDWTHFSYLHRKVVAKLKLLSKKGERTVFLYKARRLYPFPFYDYYIIFREDRPSQNGFRNVYVNAKTGAIHHLDATVEQRGDRAIVVGDHVFSLPSYWRVLPKFFMRAFLWLYQWRMDQVMDEDLEWIYELMTMQGPAAEGLCAPVVPESYNILDDVFEKKVSESADASFQYRVVENFDGKGRLRLKK